MIPIVGKFHKRCRAITAWIIIQAALTNSVFAETVHIAAASNFAAPAKSLIELFESSTGHKGVLSLGSSGKFYAQILNGAPFDVFFSADQTKPALLEGQGKTVEGTRQTYAVGKLVLWSSRSNYIDDTPSILKEGTFTKLAMANPRLAPYGIAAVEVLETLHLRQDTEAKWVQGENIAQTYQFVQTGNADLGFVALSQLVAANDSQGGSSWLIPDHYHQPIRQDVVQLKRSASNPAANAFIGFIRTKEAREIIEFYGYESGFTTE